jgi:hypothetical protein
VGGCEGIGLRENKDELNNLLRTELKSTGFQCSLLLCALC